MISKTTKAQRLIKKAKKARSDLITLVTEDMNLDEIKKLLTLNGYKLIHHLPKASVWAHPSDSPMDMGVLVPNHTAYDDWPLRALEIVTALMRKKDS